MRTVVAVLMLTSVALSASALADPSPKTDLTKMVTPQGFPRTKDAPGPDPALDPALGPPSSVTDDCARARKAGKTCVLDVPPEDVSGQTPAAGEVGTRILVFGSAGSLLRLRRDFIPEIVRTTEHLAADL